VPVVARCQTVHSGKACPVVCCAGDVRTHSPTHRPPPPPPPSPPTHRPPPPSPPTTTTANITTITTFPTTTYHHSKSTLAKAALDACWGETESFLTEAGCPPSGVEMARAEWDMQAADCNWCGDNHPRAFFEWVNNDYGCCAGALLEMFARQ
jgi:hypothetical protein